MCIIIQGVHFYHSIVKAWNVVAELLISVNSIREFRLKKQNFHWNLSFLCTSSTRWQLINIFGKWKVTVYKALNFLSIKTEKICPNHFQIICRNQFENNQTMVPDDPSHSKNPPMKIVLLVRFFLINPSSVRHRMVNGSRIYQTEGFSMKAFSKLI